MQSACDLIKNDLIEAIRVRGKTDSYIDRSEEREILQFALQKGLMLDQGHQVLLEVCGQSNYIMESHLLEDLLEQIKSFAKGGNGLTEKFFLELTKILLSNSKGYLQTQNAQEMIIALIEDNGFEIETGFFGYNWFLKIKKSLKLASFFCSLHLDIPASPNNYLKLRCCIIFVTIILLPYSSEYTSLSESLTGFL
jgi:hypothetical protein